MGYFKMSGSSGGSCEVSPKFFEWLKKVKIDNRIKLDKSKSNKK
jgi:hypothetical protein